MRSDGCRFICECGEPVLVGCHVHGEIFLLSGRMPRDRVRGTITEIQKVQTPATEIYLSRVILESIDTDEITRLEPVPYSR